MTPKVLAVVPGMAPWNGALRVQESPVPGRIQIWLLDQAPGAPPFVELSRESAEILLAALVAALERIAA